MWILWKRNHAWPRRVIVLYAWYCVRIMHKEKGTKWFSRIPVGRYYQSFTHTAGICKARHKTWGYTLSLPLQNSAHATVHNIDIKLVCVCSLVELLNCKVNLVKLQNWQEDERIMEFDTPIQPKKANVSLLKPTWNLFQASGKMKIRGFRVL